MTTEFLPVYRWRRFFAQKTNWLVRPLTDKFQAGLEMRERAEHHNVTADPPPQIIFVQLIMSIDFLIDTKRRFCFQFLSLLLNYILIDRLVSKPHRVLQNPKRIFV
jgi:hypothetical protein